MSQDVVNTLRAALLLLHQLGGVVRITVDSIESFHALLEAHKDEDITIGAQQLPDGVLLVMLVGKEIDAWQGRINGNPDKADTDT